MAAAGACAAQAPIRPTAPLGMLALEADIEPLGPAGIFEDQAEASAEDDNPAGPWNGPDDGSQRDQKEAERDQEVAHQRDTRPSGTRSSHPLHLGRVCDECNTAPIESGLFHSAAAGDRIMRRAGDGETGEAPEQSVNGWAWGLSKLPTKWCRRNGAPRRRAEPVHHHRI